MAQGVGAVVVAVDYRLAPEHPAPAAHDDVYAAAAWASEHAAEYGSDAGKIALVGDSAGGNSRRPWLLPLGIGGVVRKSPFRFSSTP